MPSSAFLNLGILAHVDAGKTTLTEQMLFAAGSIREAGSVDDGNTRTDSLSVERERGISVRTATASLLWQGKIINIVDTPGHVDFAGEVERCLGALDIAIVVVSAPDGVRAHTEISSAPLMPAIPRASCSSIRSTVREPRIPHPILPHYPPRSAASQAHR